MVYVNFMVTTQPKHIVSTQRKMRKKNKDNTKRGHYNTKKREGTAKTARKQLAK